MIVCKDCGHKNQNATTFCESCGTFLEWAGESVLTGAHPVIPAPEAPPEPVQEAPAAPAPEAPPPPSAPPTSPPPPPAAAAPEAPAEVVGATGAAFQAQRLPVIAEPTAPPPPPADAPAAEQPKAPGAARPGTQVLRAMRMKARPAPPPPAAPAGPVARPPAEEHERRAPRPPSTEPPRPQGNPADIFCSSCGTPNDPSRHYCRSCGNQLVGVAPVAAPHLSWWRRLLGRRAKVAAPLPAGSRPEAGPGASGHGVRGAGSGAVNSVAHVARRFFQVIAVLGALGIAVVAIGPWRAHAHRIVSGWVQDVRRIVQPHYVLIVPDKISASSSLKANPPQNAFDGVTQTFWAEGARGDGTGQSLVVRFTKAVSIARIGVLDGDQSTVKAFATRPVPRTLRLIFYDANGAVVKRARIGLEQTPNFQRFSAGASGVTRLVIRIAATYPSEKGKRSSGSIAEIELFKKD